MASFGPDKSAITSDSPISDFFRGKCVFLTGCTGFLGHLYLEKLLRYIKHLGKMREKVAIFHHFEFCFRLDAKLIYVLMRPKCTQSCAERLEQILRQPIFTELLQANSNICDRIRIVTGTLVTTNADILDQETLNEIDIVIHSAANVSFDNKLFDAIETNVYGTYQLLQLCTQMPHLLAFLYVSTAFAQTHHHEPEEQFYDPVVDPMLLIKCYQRFGAKCTNENERNAMEAVMMKLMAEHKMLPYTLSKNAAEALVQSYAEREHYPIAVIRPSIGEYTVYTSFT